MNGKNNGFTLIELLIVIAILGVLIVVALIAINPAERQAQTRDTGRKTTVIQLGQSLQSYFIAFNSQFPTEATWAQDLVNTSELATFPAGLPYSRNGITNCTSFVQPAIDPTYCYNYDDNNGPVIYAAAESTTILNKCISPELPYFVFSFADSKGGTICSSAEPTPWAVGGVTYVD